MNLGPLELFPFHGSFFKLQLEDVPTDDLVDVV